MADAELIAPMPALELTQGEVLKLEARDPTTGAEIAGVVVTNFVIYASEGEDRTLTEEPFHTIYLAQADGDLGRNPADFGGPAG